MFFFSWFTKQERSTGESGEDTAARFLKKRGYKILARNFQNDRGRRLGEIDIIAREHDMLVFVEVKTRDVAEVVKAAVRPEAQITPAKLHKMNRIAQVYIAKNNLWHMSHRFDAIAVTHVDGQKPCVRHLKNIFF